MSKETKTEIKKIVLDVGGKEVSLTVDEAKKLKELLSELFGREVIKEVIHEHHKHYDWWWRNPNIVYCQTGTAKFADNTVYCSTGGGSVPDLRVSG